MAEAVVNLTSIKKRVSRGMETVGGPIDVAVISQSEGFVWIKRKHYFPPELNNRYFSRASQKLNGHGNLGNGQTSKSRRARADRRREMAGQLQAPIEGYAGGSADNSGEDTKSVQ